jgi:hypothetical protein
MTAPLPLMTRADIDNGLYHGVTLDTNGTGSSNFGGDSSGSSSSSTPGSASITPGAAAQFADTTRSLESPLAAAATQQQQQPPPAPPDLDALAQQVYTILKRRLSAERRRLN